MKEFFWSHLPVFSKEKESKTKVQFLKSIPFFSSLSEWDLKSISSVIHERTYSEGECFFEYNHPGAALFIIASGEVSIEVPRGMGNMTQVAVLGEGTFLGELALLDDTPRTATARALSVTQAYALFRDDLNSLVTTEPEIACQIFKSLSTIVGQRLVVTTQQLTKKKKIDAA